MRCSTSCMAGVHGLLAAGLRPPPAHLSGRPQAACHPAACIVGCTALAAAHTLPPRPRPLVLTICCPPGCILGELINGKPIFPGTSTMNQLDRILEVTGRPSPQDIDSIQSPFAGGQAALGHAVRCGQQGIHEAVASCKAGGHWALVASATLFAPLLPTHRHVCCAATMLESMRAPATPRLEATFPSASPEALDLLQKLLQFNPDKRISPEGALRHPYCAQFHNPHDEPVAPGVITIPIDDNTKVRRLLFQWECGASQPRVAAAGCREPGGQDTKPSLAALTRPPTPVSYATHPSHPPTAPPCVRSTPSASTATACTWRL